MDGPAGGIGAPAEIPPLQLPEPAATFDARAARLAALARDHPAAPFLELLARVARAQRVAARELPIPPRPGPPGGGRPLDRARLARDPAWRAMLRLVIAGCRGEDLPAPAREALDRLATARDAALEEHAASVLADAPRDLAAAPFVGAALQVWFTRLAAGLDPGAVPPATSECPVCGAPPVAGVIMGNDRSRHLVCALCATRWHLPRVRCAACHESDALSYLSLEGAPPGIQAEACGHCRGYLKLLDLAADPAAEPVADDAASIVLDLLMGERGHHRIGVNLLAPAAHPA